VDGATGTIDGNPITLAILDHRLGGTTKGRELGQLALHIRDGP
jgi:hypothetical protein